jgi:nucleotide-binding universal stress UspA family protein
VFKHILVPVDLSHRHQHALEVAARLARESHGEARCCMSSKSFQGHGRRNATSISGSQSSPTST